jgi:hypothetical protein
MPMDTQAHAHTHAHTKNMCTFFCPLTFTHLTSYSTYLLTYGTDPLLRSCQLCSHSRTSQHFMEPEGSLPHSQEPYIGPYPEPN